MSVLVFEHVRGIFDTDIEAAIAGAIILKLPPKLRKQAFGILSDAVDQSILPDVLTKNFANADSKLKNQIIKFAKGISSPLYRAQAFINLSLCCEAHTRKEVLKYGLALALSFSNGWHQARYLIHLLPLLDKETQLFALETGLQAAWTIQQPTHKVEALTWFVPYLGSSDIDKIIDYAVQITSITFSNLQTVKILTKLLSYSISENRRKSLIQITEKIILTLNDNEEKVEALIRLACQSKITNLREIIRTVINSNSDSLLFIVLTELLPKLDKDLVEAILADTLTIYDAETIQKSWNVLSPYIADNNEQFCYLLKQKIDHALYSDNEQDDEQDDELLILWKINLLKRYLTPDLIHYAIDEAHNNSQTNIEKKLTIAFAQNLDQNLLREIIEHHVGFEDEENSVEIIMALAPYLGTRIK